MENSLSRYYVVENDEFISAACFHSIKCSLQSLAYSLAHDLVIRCVYQALCVIYIAVWFVQRINQSNPVYTV